MNLTKYDRTAFVNAVINDVPTEDYREQAISYAALHAITYLPKALQDAIKKNEAVLDHLRSTYCHIGSFGIHLHGSSTVRDTAHNDEELMTKVKRLSDLHDMQKERIDELRTSLTGVIGACRTLKQAKERLPEFEKYLPTERGSTGVTNLPVANVVAELTKLGWPKGQKAARGSIRANP